MSARVESVEVARDLLTQEPVANPEHELNDHRQRQLPGARVDRDHVAGPPAGDLRRGELTDPVRVRANPLAVERGQLQAPPGEVLGRLEHDQRTVAEERPQEVVAVPLAQRIAGEQRRGSPRGRR